MSTTSFSLIIQHIGQGDLHPNFRVMRHSDNKYSSDIEIESPYRFLVKDRPNDNLMSQLRWYLEEFLTYPFSPRTEQATKVEQALKSWGEKTFFAIFGRGFTKDLIVEWKRKRNENPLHIQISSDDPAVHSWPWEALLDSEIGILANQAQIERRVNQKLHNQTRLSDKLPRKHINILLITARPYKRDVRYRSISRPLVELIKKENIPASVTMLRPPTFDQLQRHLQENPFRYHILHFDGHGAHNPDITGMNVGRLIFETKDSHPDELEAPVLSELLKKHSIPLVVLNACQGAMQTPDATDPFSSVAAALLKAGIRSVVAMSYSIYVRGAQKFLPSFYHGLFTSGNIADATRQGRQAMHTNPQRTPINPEVKLQDWVIPVIYQQDRFDLSFVDTAHQNNNGFKENFSETSGAKGAEFTTSDFIGRDGAILELERAMRQESSGILIHGLGGIGKTTLVRIFLKWLNDTGGLNHDYFWFTFDTIMSAIAVINEMGRKLFGPQFGVDGIEKGMNRLISYFQNHPYIIVWDNFESVCGIEGTEVKPLLSEEDQGLLHDFLVRLMGGKTKVIITSRGDESWLGEETCYPLPLAGLHGEEVWDYAAQILDNLGVKG